MTYSVVARCPDTGQLGVAAQSHWFAVGSLVTWCRSGAGAVATQAVTDVAYGPRAMMAMADGATAEEALSALLASDHQKDLRQILVLDGEGRNAVHTGAKCIEFASHAQRQGAAFGANVMTSAGVPEAMADSWDQTAGQPLARRMLQALEAAQARGGDLRGQQSAALRVHSPLDGEWWEGVNIDIRVDDHAEPLAELRRLITVREAYTEAEFAEAAESHGRQQEATLLYERAGTVLPRSSELSFWRAVSLYKDGRVEEAETGFETLFADDPRWAELLRRLSDCGQLECDALWLSKVTAL